MIWLFLIIVFSWFHVREIWFVRKFPRLKNFWFKCKFSFGEKFLRQFNFWAADREQQNSRNNFSLRAWNNLAGNCHNFLISSVLTGTIRICFFSWVHSCRSFESSISSHWKQANVEMWMLWKSVEIVFSFPAFPEHNGPIVYILYFVANQGKQGKSNCFLLTSFLESPDCL